MLIHLAIDLQYLYYKYKFTLDSGRMKRLSAGGVDISNIYYPVREIETIRKQFQSDGSEVVVSIFMDSKSKRIDIDSSYKANRVSKLTDYDFDNIAKMGELLREVGYNIYKEEGYEADDLLYHVVTGTKDDFGFTVIYTPDSDQLSLVCKNVGLRRFKNGKGYTSVGVSNFEEYCQAEFKCCIPFNAIMLYKVMCGDKADGFPGIKGFGPAAFNKFIISLGDAPQWDQMCNADYVEEILNHEVVCQYIGHGKVQEALSSLVMARPMPLEDIVLIHPADGKACTEKRREAYTRALMPSLAD